MKPGTQNPRLLFTHCYLRLAFTAKFHRGKIADLVNLLSGRDFATREYKTEIAEESFRTLHDAVLDVVNKTNFQRYLMIVKSVGIVDASLIRSQNVLNFGYDLYLALRDKGIQANLIETIVRRWLVLSILTGRYSGSAEDDEITDSPFLQIMNNKALYFAHFVVKTLSLTVYTHIIESTNLTRTDQ